MSVKAIASLVLSMSLLVGLFLISSLIDKTSSSTQDEFFRIHIRANSNDTIDQNVKYEVKDKIVKFLTPYLCEAEDKASAMQIVNNMLPSIESLANDVLAQNGLTYTSSGVLYRETFPMRVYGDVVLPAGEYDSLIINLGSGKGNNWWCVVYPPLCFVGDDNMSNVVYKSKLAEIINSFWRRMNAY